MAKSISYNKREVEKRKQEKRLEKQRRREERKANPGSGSLDDMIAYVDEFGVITDTPPEPVREEIDLEDIAISIPKMEEVEKSEPVGRVDFCNPDKGFGFIKHAHGTDSYFFHISSAPANIKEGDKVKFELERGDRGLNAVNIVITD